MELSTITLCIITFIILGIFAIQRYMSKDYSYWKNAGIPSVPTKPFLGSMASIFSKPIHVLELERYKKYGRIYGHYEASRPGITIAEPEILKNIFVKDFHAFQGRREFNFHDDILDNILAIAVGEKWKRIRSIMTPAFTTGKIRRMTDIIIDSTKTLDQQFGEAANSGKPIDAKQRFGAFTLDVIVSTAFGTKIDSHSDPNNEFVVRTRQLFNTQVTFVKFLFFLFPKLSKLFGGQIGQMQADFQFFKDVTQQIIKDRRLNKTVRNDFLQLMIDSTKEGSSETSAEEMKGTIEDNDNYYFGKEEEESSKKVFKAPKNFKSLTEDEMTAQCVMFFFAGSDTSSTTLSFVFYELALNPSVQERLIRDVDEAVVAEGKLTYIAIQNMTYLDMVISETLRKYPPGVRIERTANEDYQLKSPKITIPKGTVLGCPTYAMHHDPEFFPDPEKFDPERFSTEGKLQRIPYSYLPFGVGPRNCLGMRFVLMEMKICISYLLLSYRVKRCSETKVPVELTVGLQSILQPKEVNIVIERRRDKKFDVNSKQ